VYLSSISTLIDFAVETMSKFPQPTSETEQVEVWKTLQEAEWRSKDRELQEKLAATPWYKNALIVGILVTAVTIGGNLVASVINHSNTLEAERFKAEGERVLQAPNAENSNQAAANLRLLRESELITGELKRKIGVYIDERQQGQGAVIGRGTPPRPHSQGLTLEFGDGDPLVALLVSHDKFAKGAYSPFLDNYEYDVSFDLSVEIAREVRNRGGKAFVLTRATGNSMGFKQKILQIGQRLDKIKPRLGIEIHFSAAESEEARGTEVLFGEHANPQLREIAEELGDESAKILGTRFRDARRVTLEDRAGYIVNRPNTPTLLLELFFGSNAQDSSQFQEKRGEIVKRVADLILEWNG
jgi:hypothetical protein